MSCGETVATESPVKLSARKRVLVIDDDASIRMLLQMGLKLRGFDCVVADNGIVAQRVLQTEHFDAILVDLMMPMMDGLSFIVWLRKTAQIEIPVLVLTSVHNPDTTHEALKLGASGVAHKPIRIALVMEELTKLIADPG